MSPRVFAPADCRWLLLQGLGLLLIGGLLLAIFENTRLDIALSSPWFDASTRSFPWQHHWFFDRFLHHGMKVAAYAAGFLALAVCALGWRGQLPWLPKRNAQLAAAGMVLIPLLTSLIKHLTNRHCPWDVVDFGGYAPYVSLFADTPGDLVRGVCFPAGHASAGFVWIIWAVALRATQPKLARRLLVGGLAAGALLGLGRLFQGAHFASHVLWSGWFAWTLSLALAAALRVPVTTRVLLEEARPEYETPDGACVNQAE